jgi:starch phosphorylase
LDGLGALSQNLWWSWNHSATELFRSLDPELWEQTEQNPVAFLSRLRPETLEARAREDAIRYRVQRELENLNEYRERLAWFSRTYPRETTQPLVAYFCAEYGLAASFRIYSGGLGVLAGDHLKAASDLGIPLVAVGLFYHRGYFRQRLSMDGWQLEGYPYNDAAQQPMQLVKSPDGSPRRVHVTVGGEKTLVQIWRVDVGRVALYLLDTNIVENPPHLRSITDRLYGGDRNHRISQEIVLGIGGVRALEAMGIEPDVYHMNEGHAAFLIVERLRRYVERGLPLPAAVQAVQASNVFTTHTPVPAGNENFANDLLQYHLNPYLNETGIVWEQFLKWGQVEAGQGEFGMTILALRFSSYANGVSRLHGDVSRRMWQKVWDGVLTDETPIRHITNGVHTATWVSDELADLYDSYLGPRWRDEPHDASTWNRIDDIPPAELWRAHERSRERLIGFTRQRLTHQLKLRNASSADLRAAAEALDPKTLTIGFARRFATYKRAYLLLRDPDRLIRLLTNREHPVQFIFAGKSHPDDHPAKDMIRAIVQFAQRPEVRRHIVFVEDYDMHIASLLVAGADVWLNTPRRPLEASGTSGMKAVCNGVLNASILDGWWDEAYRDLATRGEFGWGIDNADARDAGDEEVDNLDAGILYTLFEREIVPLFYDRGADNVPREWVQRMKNSIRLLTPVFNTHRMLVDYVRDAYVPVSLRSAALIKDDAKGARELGAWKERIQAAWSRVAIKNVEIDAGDVVTAGTPVMARVEADLGGLDAKDVRAEVAVGLLHLTDISAPLERVECTPLRHNARRSVGGITVFDGRFTCRLSGHVGVTVRLLPNHPNLATPVELGLIRWAG